MPSSQRGAANVCGQHRSGGGGNGEVVEAGRGRWVRNFKYRPNRGQKKEVWLPASEPADGQRGGNVIIVVDASVRPPCTVPHCAAPLGASPALSCTVLRPSCTGPPRCASTARPCLPPRQR